MPEEAVAAAGTERSPPKPRHLGGQEGSSRQTWQSNNNAPPTMAQRHQKGYAALQDAIEFSTSPICISPKAME